MKVKEIMSFPVIAEDEDVPVAKIIKHMELSRVGSVVITSEGKTIGIIVDQDIAAKVILKDINPDEMKAKEICRHTPLFLFFIIPRKGQVK
ncbi:MAG: CBS domain-containing protein [Methanophagales archaeon]|nr:CBS domain-containing protein [Methanophagales archaeon]